MLLLRTLPTCFHCGWASFSCRLQAAGQIDDSQACSSPQGAEPPRVLNQVLLYGSVVVLNVCGHHMPVCGLHVMFWC
ncbi:unnamed protein product [Lota lota]